jgi:hypothetical protein
MIRPPHVARRTVLFSRQWVPVTPPAGFTFTLPFTIQQRGRTFRPLAWDVSSLEPATTAALYVSPSGSDVNDGRDLAHAKRTIENAIGSMTQATTIWLADGFYGENAPAGTGGHWRGNNPAYDLVLKAIHPGQVINSPKVYQLSWTVYDAPTHTYQANYASGVFAVWDGKILQNGDYIRLTAQASIAAVQANAGSWYQTAGVVYVHLADDRPPDSDLHVFRDMNSAYCTRDGITIYLEGIEFQGGTNGAGWFRNASAAGGLQIYAKNCRFKYSGYIGGLAIEGANAVICQDCESARNQNDGFNYHVRNGVAPDAIEIRCAARDNGIPGGDNDNNGSSIHDGGRVLRLMGRYYNSAGPNVIDIDNALSYNLGCQAFDSLAAAGSGHNYYIDGSMWLDCCESHGAAAPDYDLFVLSTGDALYHRHLISGGNFRNAGGTLEVY